MNNRCGSIFKNSLQLSITLIGAGFTIEKMIEPLPTDELLEKYPDYKDLFHKPDFLLIKANK